jgi:hypothetical protein
MKNTNTKQTTVREINAHVFAGTGYCVIRMNDGSAVRISRAKTQSGQKMGRVVNGSPLAWIAIPEDAVIELS